MSPTNSDSSYEHNFRMFEIQRQIHLNRLELARRASRAQQTRLCSHTRRDREAAHQRLMGDYFGQNGRMPKYDDRVFRRRFRMYLALFRRILTGVVGADPTFLRRRDAVGHWSISPEVKITLALRMLASGCTADSLDEYFQLGESTALDILKKFCTAIVNVYGVEYLREPTREDLEKLLAKASQRGFPGMIGSIDCMHWEWRNCPTGWAGQYTGHAHRPRVVLEAVAGYNTWIWHAYFGTAGSLNNINIIGQSPVFDRILNGSTPSLRFKVNESWYDTCYYLADGIYPAWSTLVKTIANPTDNKEALFAERQEGYRKDVEKAFGISQARWAIVRNPARSWDVPSLKNIMLTCIILHNMIVEDEQVNEFDEMRGDLDYEFFEANMPPNIPPLQQYFARNASIRDGNEHRRLKKDLIEHLWNEAGRWHYLSMSNYV